MHQAQSTNRARDIGGFTLVELLVVVAIIGVLMALLMPAVQMAREAGRRIACGSNLRQLGIALQQFHEHYGHFPPGRGGPPPTVFSPQAYLLPFVEQGGLQGQLDLNAAPTNLVIGGVPYSGAVNAAAAAQTVPILQCPSDPAAGRVMGSSFGGTNYVACVGSGTIDNGTVVRADGVFFLTSRVRVADLIDGSSHTAAFSERPLGSGEAVTSALPADVGLYILELNSVNVSIAACSSSSSGGWYSQRSAKWILGNYGNTLYNHYFEPNARQWDCMNPPQQKGFLAARSDHVGGVQLLCCDGSTRFIVDAVDLAVWRGLATRAGREAATPP
ncbi:MAG: DUF1559 domain-containing protein [Pirellulales bacterium]